ncbi:MAG: hypothetical protein NWS22_14970 [Porticoccaceae bacterium]|nr:hypothetical protein [Porticoccaceae bacterium]MDP4942776.1 hypothetical protein [OM182 bacterium]
METWNNLIDKFDLLLEKFKLGNTVKIAGKEISPVVMGFALIVICIPIWGYLEIGGKNKLIGAVVVVLMAWGVAQLGALGLGDGVGEKPGSFPAGKTFASGNKRESNQNSIVHPEGESDAEPDQQKLILLAFAGVLVALFVIYLLRNFDRYEDLSIEFRYKELIDMVEPIKDTIGAALLSESDFDINLLDSGEAGLPNEVLVSEQAHGISVIDGQIIATWRKDDSDIDGVTYILTPDMEDGGVEWATTGTCGGKNAC